MRGIESLILVLLVGLLGVGIWEGSKWLPSHRALFSSAPDAKGLPDAKTDPKLAKGLSKHKPGSGREVLRATPSGFSESTPESTTIINVPWTPRGPVPSDLPAGTTRNQLRDRYGNPLLSVSAMRDGLFIERYYYLSRDQAHLTVATLQDGAVVAAETVTR